MNIKDVKKNVPLGEHLEDEVGKLEGLLDFSGNCVMNGFLGEGVEGITKDNFGNLEYITFKRAGQMRTDSRGAVMDDIVVIKQTQSDDKTTYHQIFSWDLDKKVYTFMAFSDEDSMNYSYERIKALKCNLCDGDITKKIEEIGIPLNNVNQVLVKQRVDIVDTMFEEEKATDEKTSFILH